MSLALAIVYTVMNSHGETDTNRKLNTLAIVKALVCWATDKR